MDQNLDELYANFLQQNNANLAPEEQEGPPMQMPESEVPEESSFFEEMSGIEEPDDYEEQAENPEFNANLANYLTDSDLKKIAADEIKNVEDDLKSRTQWLEFAREVAREMGIMDESDEMMEKFPGELSITYPIYMKAMIQFYSRVVPEIFPARPIGAQVLGNSDAEREDQASRVEDTMNWQYTEGDPENKRDFRKMIWWLPTAGSMFRRPYHDSLQDKIKVRTVKAEDLIVEYNTTSLSSAYRYTYRFFEGENDTLKLMQNGYYRECDIALQGGDFEEDQTQSLQDVRNASDGMSENSDWDSDIYERYYIYTYLDLPGFEDKDEDGKETGIKLPYEVCIDVNSQNVLAIYRDWKENDVYKLRRSRFAHYKYQEGFGFYGSSLYHLVGTVQRACNGALRAFNGSLAFSLMPSGFKTKEAKISGDQILRAGEFKDVDATVLDIDKALKVLTFPPPSPMVLDYIGLLDRQAEAIISTQDIMVGNSNPVNAPVGTTLALLEQANKVVTAQHQSIRESFDDEIKIVYELNYDFLPEEDRFLVPGKEGIIRRLDFDERIRVIPTSDPTKASFQMKLAADQAALQFFQQRPDLFKDNGYPLFRRVMEDMQIANLDEIMFSPQEMEQMQKQQQQNPPPPTPDQIKAQLAQQELQMKAQMDQMKQQMDMLRLELDGRRLDIESALKNKELDQRVGVQPQYDFLTEEYFSQLIKKLLNDHIAQPASQGPQDPSGLVSPPNQQPSMEPPAAPDNAPDPSMLQSMFMQELMNKARAAG